MAEGGMDSGGAKLHRGSCHCGAVRYEVTVDLSKGVSRCNCTARTKIAQTGVIVKPDAFKVTAGADQTSTYEWGGKTGTRHFCKHCGVHCFLYGNLPQLGGAYVSITVNTLDDVDVADLKVGYWDGRHNNWMAGMRDTPWPIA